MFGRTEIFAQSTHLPAEFLCWGEGKIMHVITWMRRRLLLVSIRFGQFFASYYISKTILPICLMSFSGYSVGDMLMLISWVWTVLTWRKRRTILCYCLGTQFTLRSEVNQSIGTISYIVIFVSTQDSFVNVSFQARILKNSIPGLIHAHAINTKPT